MLHYTKQQRQILNLYILYSRDVIDYQQRERIQGHVTYLILAK